MAKNLIPEIIRARGLEIDEEFQLKSICGNVSDDVYRFNDNKLQYRRIDGEIYLEASYSTFKSLIWGELEIVKLPWKPKFNEKYYTFCRVFRYREFDGWSIETYNWANTPMDVALLKTGWVFRTYEEAEAALPKVAKELGVEYEL